MQKSREQTLLALHRLGEGFINPLQEDKRECWGAHVGLLACGVPQPQAEPPQLTRKPAVCHPTGWKYTTFSHLAIPLGLLLL